MKTLVWVIAGLSAVIILVLFLPGLLFTTGQLRGDKIAVIAELPDTQDCDRQNLI